MDPAVAGRVAALLSAARRERQALEAPPDDLIAVTPDEAYAVQEALERTHGGAAAGYKIGASSAKAQAFLGVAEPFAGRVFQDTLFESPSALPAAGYIFALVEPEFAFRFAQDLPARADGYDGQAVAAAVASLHPALEIVTSAFGHGWTEVGGAALIADNGAHGGLILGPACTDWHDLDLPGHAVTLAINGTPAGSGHGANALGGPLTALTWLVNHLCGRGRGIAAGEVVTTGVVTDLATLQAGDRAVADYGSLGAVEVRLT